MRLLETNGRLYAAGLALVACACSGSETSRAPVDASSSGGAPAQGTGGAAGAAGGAGGAGGAVTCESPQPDHQIDIAGTYLDDFGGTQRVSDTEWRSGEALFQVVDWSNEERWLIARNDPDNDYNAGAYSRFEWKLEGELAYYCHSVYDADSASEARAAPRAASDDLEHGCSGFSWSALESIEIEGAYEDNYGGSHVISASAWATDYAVFHFLEFSNEGDWAVVENDCDNSYFPGAFSRFDWAWSEDGELGTAGAGGASQARPSFYYCQTGYDLPSPDEARALAAADSRDLRTGCNGFSWTRLDASDL